MSTIYKHLKFIAYFLATIMLFQSCIVYRNHIYTVEEVSVYENTNLKIKTIDGVKYKLPWIREVDGNLESIRNTSIESINKHDIESVILNDPFTYTSLENALNFNGPVFIKTKEFKVKDKLYNHAFIDIVDDYEYVKGISMINMDTRTVVIPLDQIEQIKVKNKTGSTIASISLGLGIVLLILNIYALIQWSNESPFNSMSFQ